MKNRRFYFKKKKWQLFYLYIKYRIIELKLKQISSLYLDLSIYSLKRVRDVSKVIRKKLQNKISQKF